MSTETKYIVFCINNDDGDSGTFYSTSRERPEDRPLQGLIDFSANFAGYSGRRFTPVCWAVDDGGDIEQLRHESLSAGRTIEKVDGRYVARGVPVEEKPQTYDRWGMPRDGYYFMRGKLEAQKPETPPFSVRVGTTEKKRPRLTWADSKPVDRFPGFSVSYDGEEQKEQTFSPLQIVSSIDRDPKNGSAFLKEMKG